MKTLATFEEWPLRVPNFEKVLAQLKKFIEGFKEAESPEEALKAFRKVANFSDKINDDLTHISVLYTLDTTNEKYQKANALLDEQNPYLASMMVSFSEALVHSPYRAYLEEKLGSLLFTMHEYSLKSFDEKIIEEAQEENRLVTEYGTTIASLRVNFRGEQYNLPQMGKFLTDNDRTIRKEAMEAYYMTLEASREKLEDLYDQLVHVRDRMAKKLGYKNYVELGYLRMSRFDYNPEMVAKYRESIREVVTPIASKIAKNQAKMLGLKKLGTEDLNVHFLSGNPVPLGDTQYKVQMAQEMYDALSPETSFFFRFMVDHHLLFLDAKPGKQSGGYMTYFPVHKCPIIFSNFNGTSGDVDVLTHEFGHSFQAYMARGIKIAEYRMPTMESCEIDSMSMEFFAEPYMSLFFEQPDKYRYTHLADSISFLPYGVTVDEFQEWVYENPNASKEERMEKWHQLEEKYTPYKVKAYDDCPYLMKGGRWLTQSHIFASPFYYIDYTLAQVVAFEFFNLDRKNHEKAWKKYLKLCKLGGQYPFQTLLKKIGLKSPFEDGVLKKTMTPLVKVLKSYHPENL